MRSQRSKMPSYRRTTNCTYLIENLILTKCSSLSYPHLTSAPEQGTSCCIASLDPEANGYLWGQICKPRCQVACERLYTPQGVEMDIQMDIYGLDWPNNQGRYLSKSAEQSSEPGCGLKTETLPLLYIQHIYKNFKSYTWGKVLVLNIHLIWNATPQSLLALLSCCPILPINKPRQLIWRSGIRSSNE